jgi:cytochrome c oxidase subunit 2
MRRLAALLLLAPGAAAAETPMSMLEGFGPRADPVVDLTWGLLWLSIGVVVLISALVLIGVYVRAKGPETASWKVSRTETASALRWIYIGLALTVVALAAFGGWTMTTMASIREPAEDPPLTIEITGHQWWWEVVYVGADEEYGRFTTANEIHIPVGVPVRVRLASADVIHSFWVPALGGKTDLIPGQINVVWMEADTPGVFRGRCAEYCGLQHAHMALRVFAQPRAEFVEWWEEQLKPAPEPETELAALGRDLFVVRCGACHSVRGTLAQGALGPDLSHLMDRTTLASGMLPNTVGHLSGWIANPQHLKPGTTMPNPDLSGPELAAVRAFLLTLE